MMLRKLLVGLIVSIPALPGGGQAATGQAEQAQQGTQHLARANRLLTGKMVYVTPMPGELDRWISEDLSAWRRYRVTANPEGVDLVIRARENEKETPYKIKQGVPQPKKERHTLPVLSISIDDWVTNQPLWRMDLVDRKPGKDEPEASTGPTSSVPVRGLVPDQIAQKFVTKLREYVEGLEKAESGKP